MFGLFNNRSLFEQKRMLWQNFFGSLELIKRLEEYVEIYPSPASFTTKFSKDRQELLNRLIEKLNNIHEMSAAIINSELHKNLLDKDRFNHIWQNNKVLREIYDEHINAAAGPMFMPGGPMHQSFDNFINPPYGWEIALKNWS